MAPAPKAHRIGLIDTLLPLVQAGAAGLALIGAAACALTILIASLSFDPVPEPVPDPGSRTLIVRVPVQDRPGHSSPDRQLAIEHQAADAQVIATISVGPAQTP